MSKGAMRFSAEEVECPILPDCASTLNMAANNQGLWYGTALIGIGFSFGLGTAIMGYTLAYCYLTN